MITVYRDGSVLVRSVYKKVSDQTTTVRLTGLSNGLVAETIALNSPTKRILGFDDPFFLLENSVEATARIVSQGMIAVRRRGMDPVLGKVLSNGGDGEGNIVMERRGSLFLVPRRADNTYLFPNADVRPNEMRVRLRGPESDLTLSYLTRNLRILSEATASLRKRNNNNGWEGTLTQNLRISSSSGLNTVANIGLSMLRLNWGKREMPHPPRRRRQFEYARPASVKRGEEGMDAGGGDWSSEDVWSYHSVEIRDGSYSVSVSTSNIKVSKWTWTYDIGNTWGSEPLIYTTITPDTDLPPFSTLTLVASEDGQRLGSPTTTRSPMERNKPRTVLLGTDSAVEIRNARHSWEDEIYRYVTHEVKVFSRKKTPIDTMHLYMSLSDEEELLKPKFDTDVGIFVRVPFEKLTSEYWLTVLGRRPGHTLVYVTASPVEPSDDHFHLTVTKRRPKKVDRVVVY